MQWKETRNNVTSDDDIHVWPSRFDSDISFLFVNWPNQSFLRDVQKHYYINYFCQYHLSCFNGETVFRVIDSLTIIKCLWHPLIFRESLNSHHFYLMLSWIIPIRMANISWIDFSYRLSGQNVLFHDIF